MIHVFFRIGRTRSPSRALMEIPLGSSNREYGLPSREHFLGGASLCNGTTIIPQRTVETLNGKGGGTQQAGANEIQSKSAFVSKSVSCKARFVRILQSPRKYRRIQQNVTKVLKLVKSVHSIDPPEATYRLSKHLEKNCCLFSDDIARDGPAWGHTQT